MYLFLFFHLRILNINHQCPQCLLLVTFIRLARYCRLDDISDVFRLRSIHAAWNVYVSLT